MKKIIITFIALGYLNVYSQEIKWTNIEFTQFLGNQTTKSKLCYNDKESVYYYGNSTIIDTTSFNMTYVLTDEIGSVVYKNKEKKQLFTRQANGKEVILINDEFPILNWRIGEETKKSGTINLKKASATFRGRNYIAWFDETIPVDYGPLKMGGLPGLILELSTEDNYLNVIFEKIEFDKSRPSDLDKITNEFNRSITQREWMKESKDEIDAFIAKIKSKQSRDTQVDIHFEEPLEKALE